MEAELVVPHPLTVCDHLGKSEDYIVMLGYCSRYVLNMIHTLSMLFKPYSKDNLIHTLFPYTLKGHINLKCSLGMKELCLFL